VYETTAMTVLQSCWISYSVRLTCPQTQTLNPKRCHKGICMYLVAAQHCSRTRMQPEHQQCNLRSLCICYYAWVRKYSRRFFQVLGKTLCASEFGNCLQSFQIISGSLTIGNSIHTKRELQLDLNN